MGARGPVGKAENQLARPRSRKGGDQQPVTVGERRKTTEPDANAAWHPIAIELFNSAKRSGQAGFYQDSDWWLLYSICDDLSVYKKSTRRSAQFAQTLYSAMERLLIAEGDRRRVRLELHEPEKPKPALSLVGKGLYQDRLNAA